MTWEGGEGCREAPAWGTLHGLVLLLLFANSQVLFGLVFSHVSHGLATQLLASAGSIVILLPAVFAMVGGLGAGHGAAAVQLGLRRPRPGSFRGALAAAGAGALTFAIVGVALGRIVRSTGRGWEDFPVQPLVRMISAQNSGLTLVGAAVLAIVGAPVSEELLFRSVLYQPMRARIGVVPAAVVVGLLFAALHGYVWGVPLLLVLSVTFTALFERTGSLWYPIAAHALYNGATFLLVRLVSLPGGSGAV